MNKKIVAGALLGALSLGVGLNISNVIPEANYQESVKTKEVGNIKRAFSKVYDCTPKNVKFQTDFNGYNRYAVFEDGRTYLFEADVLTEPGIDTCFLDYYSIKVNFSGGCAIADYPDDELNKKEWIIVTFDRIYEYEELRFYMNATYLSFEITDAQPVISGRTNFVVNVNNMLTPEQILSHVSAYDDTDGALPVQIDERDGNYTYNHLNKKTGKFSIPVYAVDAVGNRTDVLLTIHVVDIDKPVISGTNSYTRSYDEPISLDQIKQGLTVSDNYDSNLQLTVVSDSYTGHERELGTKTVTFKTKDSSNNESNIFTVTINVEDKKKPVLTGPSEIRVSSSKKMEFSEFSSKFTAIDGLDGTVSINFDGQQKYYENTKLCTTHVITVSATDKSGNRVEKKVNLIVEDKSAPGIFVDKYFVILAEGQTLTKEQLIEYASKSLGVSSEAISDISGEYDTNVTGNYKLSVKLVTGEVKELTLGITAVKNYTERSMKWHEYLYKWFTIAFNIEDGYYHTDSFFNFGSRFKKIGELYSTGIYKELIK